MKPKPLNYIRRAMEISVKEKLPIYDTLYIALAESKSGEK
jgi:predicted nucleic acid-binding protein